MYKLPGLSTPKKTPSAKGNRRGLDEGDERNWCGEGLLNTLKFSA